MTDSLTIKDIKESIKHRRSKYFYVACKMTLDSGRICKRKGVIRKGREGFLLDSTGWLEIFVADRFYKRIVNKIAGEDLDILGYAEIRLVDPNKPLFALKDFAPSDNLKITDIYEAIKNSNLKLLRELIGQGTDIECRGHIDRSTPLMIAADYAQPLVAMELIKAGAVVNAEDTSKRTALMNAAGRGCFETFNLLIENGADTSKLDIIEESLLDYAIIGENKEIIDHVKQIQEQL